MRYSVQYSKKALRQLRKLDQPVRTRIVKWIIEHLEGCEDPRKYGRALINCYKGEWRYRVWDYRIIAEIHDDKVIILVTEVGHRSNIYD